MTAQTEQDEDTIPPGNGRGSIHQIRDTWLMRPASWVYAAGRLAHRGIYDLHLMKRARLERPVFCVGNLTVGGTGKTPFLIMLAREFQERGLRPAILSRGYGASPPAHKPRIVSTGARIACEPRLAGDEPLLLARSCPEVPVVIGSSRRESGELAIKEFSPDLLLLDDGFQHEPLARDVNMVLWDMRDVPNQMRQLPAGRLREGLRGLSRATAIILTHGEYLNPSDLEAQRETIIQQLKLAAPAAPIFEAATQLAGLRRIGRLDMEPFKYESLKSISGKRILLVSALARPDGFETMISRHGGAVIDHMRHDDHAEFSRRTLRDIEKIARQKNIELTLTTEKDAVKLETLDGELPPIHAVGITMEVLETERWRPFLELLLQRHVARPSQTNPPEAPQ